MAKVAKLVVTSFCSRVVVDENASQEEIVAAVIIELQALIDNNEIGENLECIMYGQECPFGTIESDTPLITDHVKKSYPIPEWRLLSCGFDHIDTFLFRKYYNDYMCIDIEEILFDDMNQPQLIQEEIDHYLLNNTYFSQESREIVVECLCPVKSYFCKNYPLVVKTIDDQFYAVYDYEDLELKEHDSLSKNQNIKP